MNKKCMIVGASPDAVPETLAEYASECDVICADGGQQLAFRAGLRPVVIAGDFDSSAYPENIGCEIIKLPVHKDDTDTMYCIREALKRGYDEYILAGMTGGRPDHTYANYCSLLHLVRHGKKAMIVDESGETYILSSSDLSTSSMFTGNRKGSCFSIFPFACESCCVTLSGMEYELDHGLLTCDFPLGVSNTVISPSSSVTVHDGTAIIIIQ